MEYLGIGHSNLAARVHALPEREHAWTIAALPTWPVDGTVVTHYHGTRQKQAEFTVVNGRRAGPASYWEEDGSLRYRGEADGNALELRP